MTFQLSAIVNGLLEAEKIVSLFMTYNGVTNKVYFKHDALATPEAAKNTLTTAVVDLLDAYVANKS